LEEEQAVSREAEDAHFLQRYNNQFARADLVDQACDMICNSELLCDEIFDEVWDSAVQSHVDEVLADDHPVNIQSARETNKRVNAARASERADKKAKTTDRFLVWADALFLTYSWNARKDRCIIAFSETFAQTGSMQKGYTAGSRSARVCERTAWSWVHDFNANEGFHSENMWGEHPKVPCVLDDEDIKAQCYDWINAHEPRRGRAGFTALHFAIFLVGDQRMSPPSTGILTDILEKAERSAITERTANSYLHRLGRHYDWLQPGTFSDKHEDFADDRLTRFLPKEQWYFDHGPNFFEDADGKWHSVDDVEEFTEEFFENPKFCHNILGGDGDIRRINLGGQFHPDNQGPLVLYYSHDESCFAACETRQKGWQDKKRQIVRDKKRPSMLHASSRSCRYGNGSLCLDPNGPTGFIWLKGPGGLLDWYGKYNSGQPAPLPKHTDCFMNPGHAAGKDGYWMGAQFRMQCALSLETFKAVYRAIVPEGFVPTGSAMDVPMEFLMVDQLDWSQNHAELEPRALDAKKMSCNPGGEQKHLKHTFYTADPSKIAVPRWIECTPGCTECQQEFAEHGHKPGFQGVGRKGLWQVLKERHAYDPKYRMPDCVKALQVFSDFQPPAGGENSLVYDMYVKSGFAHAFFGVKYHAELASIERKWMQLKQAIRGLLDGTIPTLRDVIKKHWSKYTVLKARKDARHVRETCAVYKAMGENPSLAALEVGQHEYKGHRRVFDAVTGMFRALIASAKMTLESLQTAARVKTARVQKVEGEKWVEERGAKDFKSYCKRRAIQEKRINTNKNVTALMIIIKSREY
jgi:hypothetical protein